MIFQEPTFYRLKTEIQTVLNFNGVFNSVKFARLDFRSLIEEFEKTNLTGLNPPYCLIRIQTAQSVDMGIHYQSYNLPIDIILIDKIANSINTSVVTGVNSSTQTLASISGIFQGQRLLFRTSNTNRVVQSISPPNMVVLNSPISTVTNERVHSDLVSDLHIKAERLRHHFRSGQKFLEFQCMGDASCNVSDTDEVNLYFIAKNYPWFCSSVSFNAFVGGLL